ncbi:protein of unknown function [Alcaligenes faecalis subsp. faecalis]|nr:protein of unknown function [Alcaligenes faecalis subsp. faecalis]
MSKLHPARKSEQTHTCNEFLIPLPPQSLLFLLPISLRKFRTGSGFIRKTVVGSPQPARPA